MKFCYVDESGQGSEYVIVVGVVVDALRMHRTKADWDDLLKELTAVSEGRIQELKGGQLYRGNDYWRQWDSGERTSLIKQVFEWMVARKHTVTFGAVSKSALSAARSQFDLGGLEEATEWCIASMHLILGIQKQYQREKQNKGKTLFIFDNASQGEELLRYVLNPPEATGGFYNRVKKQLPLDQVIDVPYFADSRHVGLIQVADLFAFLLRLYAELAEGIIDEKYDGELQQVREWIDSVSDVFLPNSARWPKGSKDPCVRFLRAIAPPPLLEVA